MGYLVYNNRELAESQEQLLSGNIRNWMQQNLPERIESGALVSVDINGNLQPTATKTIKWADVIESVDGRFGFVCPTQNDMGNVPIEVVLNGITGELDNDFEPIQHEGDIFNI
jgi:hypothetical protein